MFFRQITHKRLRSRGTDPHEVRDFGMEAQLAKFAHLKPGELIEVLCFEYAVRLTSVTVHGRLRSGIVKRLIMSLEAMCL